MVRVAFQGERGAYSEEAVVKHFGEAAQPIPKPTMYEAVKAVEEGEADYAVIPVENTLGGSVGEALDVLLETKLKACGEIILRIVHCLIANPGEKLQDVEVVYSHPQALAQCRGFLRKLGCRTVPVYDTAGGVKMVKSLRGAASIASERAAQIYGMQVLARGIEDDPNNYTRFLVLHDGPLPKPTGRDKTSIILSVKHVPGALYRALEPFAVRHINLTRIESRPSRRKPWEYNFYIDFEGHVEDRVVSEALKELIKRVSFIKVVGSYPRGT